MTGLGWGIRRFAKGLSSPQRRYAILSCSGWPCEAENVRGLSADWHFPSLMARISWKFLNIALDWCRSQDRITSTLTALSCRLLPASHAALPRPRRHWAPRAPHSPLRMNRPMSCAGTRSCQCFWPRCRTLSKLIGGSRLKFRNEDSVVRPYTDLSHAWPYHVHLALQNRPGPNVPSQPQSGRVLPRLLPREWRPPIGRLPACRFAVIDRAWNCP